MSVSYYANTWSIIDGSILVKIVSLVESSTIDKVYNYDATTEQYSVFDFKDSNGEYVASIQDDVDTDSKYWVRFNVDTTINLDAAITDPDTKIDNLGIQSALEKTAADDVNLATMDIEEEDPHGNMQTNTVDIVFHDEQWYRKSDGDWYLIDPPSGPPQWKNPSKREMQQGKRIQELIKLSTEEEEFESPGNLQGKLLEWLGMDGDPVPLLLGLIPFLRPFKPFITDLWNEVKKIMDFIDACLEDLGGAKLGDAKKEGNHPELFDAAGFLKDSALPTFLSVLIDHDSEEDGNIVGHLIHQFLAIVVDAFFSVPDTFFGLISKAHATFGSYEMRAFVINVACMSFRIMQCFSEPLNIIPLLGIDLVAVLSGEMPDFTDDLDQFSGSEMPHPLKATLPGLFGIFWEFITTTLLDKIVGSIPKYIQGTFNTFKIARFLMAFLTDFDSAVPTIAVMAMIQTSLKAVLGPLAGIGPVVGSLMQSAANASADSDPSKPANKTEQVDSKTLRDSSEKTTDAAQAQNEDDGGEGIDISEVIDTDAILKGLLDVIMIGLELVMVIPFKVIPNVLTNIFGQFVRIGLSVILGKDCPQEYVDTTLDVINTLLVYMIGGPMALLLPHMVAFIESMYNFDFGAFIALFSSNKDDTVLIIENQYRPRTYETDGLIPNAISDSAYIPWADHFRKRPLTYFNISCKSKFLEFDPLGSGEGSTLQFGKIPDSKWCLIAPDPGKQQFYIYDMVSYYFLKTEGTDLVVTYDAPTLFELRKRSTHSIWQTHIKTLDVDQELIGYRDTDPHNDGAGTTTEDLFFRAYNEVGRTWSSLPSKKFSVQNFVRADNFMNMFEVRAFNPAGSSVKYSMTSTTTVSTKYLSLLDMMVKFPKTTNAGEEISSTIRKLIKIEGTKGSSIYIDEIGMEDTIFQSMGYALTSNAKWLGFEYDENGILGMHTVSKKPNDSPMFIPLAFEQGGETKYKIGWMHNGKYGLWSNGEYADRGGNIIGDVIVFEDFSERGIAVMNTAVGNKYIFSLRIFEGCPAGTVNMEDLTGSNVTTVVYSDQDEGKEYEDEEFEPSKPDPDAKIEFAGKGNYVKANIVDVDTGKIISMKADGTVCMDDLHPNKVVNQTMNVAYTTIDVGYLQMSDSKMTQVEAGQYKDPTKIIKSIVFNPAQANPFKLFPVRKNPYEATSQETLRYKPFIMRNKSKFQFLRNDTLKMEKLDYSRVEQFKFYALKHVDRMDSKICIRLGQNYLTQDMDLVPANEVLNSEFESYVEFRMIGYPRIQLHRPKLTGNFEGVSNELRLHYSFKANYLQGGSFCYREVSSLGSGTLDKTVMFENINAKDQTFDADAVIPDTDNFVLVYREGINEFYLTTQTSYTGVDIKARINSSGEPVYVYQVLLQNNGESYNMNMDLEILMHALNYELKPGVTVTKMAIKDNRLSTETLLVDFSMVGLVYSETSMDSSDNVIGTKLQWIHHDLQDFTELNRSSSTANGTTVRNDYVMSFHGMFVRDYVNYYENSSKMPYDIVSLNSPDGKYTVRAFGVDDANVITFEKYEPLDSYKYQLYHYTEQNMKEVDYLWITLLTIYCIVIFFGDSDDGRTLETGSLHANATQYLHSNFLGIIFVIINDFIDAPFYTIVETVTDGLNIHRTMDAGDIIQEWLGDIIGWPFFTGSHISLPSEEAAASISDWDQHAGKVMVSSGTYATMMSENNLDQGAAAIQMSNAWPRLDMASRKNQPSVYGVLTGTIVRFGRTFLTVNGCGEGAILVTDLNGDIENGDYITTSDCPGLCMKQDDDILHSYTVAKVTTSCDFQLDSDAYNCHEIQHEGRTVKVALLGCTYKCS